MGDKLIYSSIFSASSRGKRLVSMKVDANGSVYAVGDMNFGGYPLQEYVNTIPMTEGVPLNTGTGLTFVFKFATGKYPTKLRPASTPIRVGDAVTFIADVQSTTRGGTVSFFDGTQLLGAPLMADGRATLTTSLARGIHTITAKYSVDGITSPSIIQIVNAQ